MKKILLAIFLLLFITACSVKIDDLYTISFDEINVTVGFDNETVVKELKQIDSYTCLQNKKEEYILQELELYINDLNDKNSLFIDDYQINKGIVDTCSDLNGELVNNNGNVCILHKEVKGKDNTVVIYGNILNDNIDEVDRIVVSYK